MAILPGRVNESLMPTMLRIDTLGGLAISVDGAPIPRTVTAKALALLCYLAITGRPHARESLLALLWSEMSETEAQNNLRQSLFQLKRYCEPHLIVTRADIAFDRSKPYALDVEALERGHMDDVSSGDFLHGFSVRNAVEFEEWVAGQRARFGEAQAQMLLRRAAARESARDVDGALDALNRLLTRDPWREEAHRAKMLLLARAGQHSAALAQFEACKSALLRELAIAPATETQQLAARLTRSRDRAALVLPSSGGEFVGRGADREALIALLTSDTTRLVTVLGPGGIGKTRLALETVTQVSTRFLEGVVWVPLQALAEPSQVLPAILTALGLPASRAPRAALIDVLRDKEMLIALDNIEHVIDAADDIAALLEAAPALRVLVTSRERLNLRSEHAYVLNGLALDDARRLFLERARRLNQHLAPSVDELRAIERICEYVEGVPLALELAAGMMTSRDVLRIEAALRHDMTTLSSAMRDAPARQRSLRAVFEQSWALLGEAERAVARQLAVFRGGFSREAAHTVAGTTDALLTRLVDTSFVQRDALTGEDGDRYVMHELLRAFAYAALEAAGEQAAAHTRASAHFAEVLAAAGGKFDGPDEARTIRALARDDSNFALALDTAARFGDREALEKMALPLFRYFNISSMAAVWLPRLEAALSALSGVRPQPLFAVLQTRIAGALNILGEFERARALLAEALPMLPAASVSIDRDFAHMLLGNSFLAQGRLKEAETAYAQAIQSASGYVADAATRNVAIIDTREGRFEQAVDRYTRTDARAAAIGDVRGRAISQMNMASAYRAWGKTGEFEAALRVAETLWSSTNDRIGQAMTAGNLGDFLTECGRFDEAEDVLQRALAAFREIGQRHMIASMLGMLGRVAFRRGNHDEARARLTEGLALARQIGTLDQVAIHGQTLAELHVALGDPRAGHAALIDALRAARDSGETRAQYECLISLAALDTTRAPTIRAALLAQPDLPDDLRARASDNHVSRAHGTADAATSLATLIDTLVA
jgi:predicted ATPase/DNA-binding SARP family transcriptional activator/Tfp pilus assembly protein PilF